MITAPSTTATPTTRAGQRFNLRPFALLWGLLLVGIVALLPYAFTLASGSRAHGSTSPVSPELALILNAIVNRLLIGPLIARGLFLAERLGLGAPILSAWLRGQHVGRQLRAILKPALAIGLGGSFLCVLVAEYLFGPPLEAEIHHLGITLVAGGHPPAWQGALAALYGGIFEELTMRLVLLTALVWIGTWLFRAKQGRAMAVVFWIANLLTALAFGVGHLGAAQAIGLPMDALVISRTLLLNAGMAVAFGWLYWKRGIESAMLAHFCGDLVVTVVAPLVFANWIR